MRANTNRSGRRRKKAVSPFSSLTHWEFVRYCIHWHSRKVFQVLFIVVFLCFLNALPWGIREFSLEGDKVYPVERVVDGDTILLKNGARVRLMGVDTPETVKPNHEVEPFGPQASQYTRQAVAESNGQVYIRLDRNRVDKYGRFLAYVYVIPRDGTWDQMYMLNEDLLRQGLGRAMLTFNYSARMKRIFRAAQDQAKEEKAGVWGLPESGLQEDTQIASLETDWF